MYVPCPCACQEICSFNSPIVWARVGIGYRIENLQSKHFDMVLYLIHRYYVTNDELMKISGIVNDLKSVTEFTIHVINIMNNQSSLILIDEMHDDEVVGVLLLSIVNEKDFGRVFSHSNLRHGPAYETCIELKNAMHKQLDFFLDYKTNCLLRFYLTCICDEHRGKQLGFHMFRAGLELARHLCIPIACGVFTNEPGMVLAKRVGFEVIDSIDYDDWFEASGDGDMIEADRQTHVALMIAKVPPFYVSPIMYADIDEKKSSKKGKKKKNKKKGGKGKKKK